MVTVSHLCKTYPGGVQALKNISFEIHKGEFVVIVGLSGSGKSTLLRCINRLHDPTSGSISIDGREITGLKRKELRLMRSGIGMIFQHFNLIPRHSLLTNVLIGKLAYTPVWKGLTMRFTQEETEEALNNIRIVGLEGKETQRVDKLSGGQQQRVAIARALMQKPSLLLADEPVASLDPATSHSVMKYLEKVNKEMGVTIICNLHFLSLVRRYATRVIALKNGEIVFTGRPDEIDEYWFKTIYGEEAIDVTID